jgi:hypothetical protein
MPDKTRQRQPRRFKHTTNAVNVTLHTMDGTKMPVYVRDEILEAVERIARDNKLLTNVVES